MSMKLEKIQLPEKKLVGNANVALYGQPISHVQRLAIMSEDEWEDLTLEYADALDNSSKYVRIYKIAGSGDKGRDIAALYNEQLLPGEWDCYQCKHYKDPLSLSQILLEFGKLCFYTFNKEWPLPRHYYFVSPKGLGPKLIDILTIPKHQIIRTELLKKWNTDCKTLCDLDDNLRKYINEFDFSIASFIPPNDIIKTLLNSPHGAIRFGGGLPMREPNPGGFKNSQLIQAKLTDTVKI